MYFHYDVAVTHHSFGGNIKLSMACCVYITQERLRFSWLVRYSSDLHRSLRIVIEGYERLIFATETLPNRSAFKSDQYAIPRCRINAPGAKYLLDWFDTLYYGTEYSKYFLTNHTYIPQEREITYSLISDEDFPVRSDLLCTYVWSRIRNGLADSDAGE